MLKLPKNIMDHPRRPELEAYFAEREQNLREGSTIRVSRLEKAANLQDALTAAYGIGHLIQGLELIAEKLDREQKGLKIAQERAGQPPPQRLSRLLILANDGSERFYRDAEAILKRHGDRLWCCVIEATAVELGRAFTPKGNPAKALLIDDRNALGLFLSTLAKAPNGTT